MPDDHGVMILSIGNPEDGFKEHMRAPGKLDLNENQQVEWLQSKYPQAQWTQEGGTWYGEVEGRIQYRIRESAVTAHNRQKYGKAFATTEDIILGKFYEAAGDDLYKFSDALGDDD